MFTGAACGISGWTVALGDTKGSNCRASALPAGESDAEHVNRIELHLSQEASFIVADDRLEVFKPNYDGRFARATGSACDVTSDSSVRSLCHQTD